MERPHSQTATSRAERMLAHLKLISRLLGHELHAQTSPRITISREELYEIQSSIDLFIEEAMRRKGGGGLGDLDVQTVPARVN